MKSTRGIIYVITYFLTYFHLLIDLPPRTRHLTNEPAIAPRVTQLKCLAGTEWTDAGDTNK